MANHVDNSICIISENEAATAEFNRIFAELNSDDKDLRDASFLPENTMDNVGAKWAHVEDADEDSAFVTSAWSAVLPFVEHLGKHLAKIDPDVRICNRYFDEGYNFVGAAVWHDDFLDIEEEDCDELIATRATMLDEDPEEYDPWEDDEFHEWVSNRVDSFETDLLESCEEKVESNVL